jgi:hypothetical protein
MDLSKKAPPASLTNWLADHGGPSAKQVLVDLIQEKTGHRVRWATIHDIARGASTPTITTAKLIEAATGGAVKAAELIGFETSDAA